MVRQAVTLFFLLTSSFSLLADDRGKAEKELRKIVAMATDATGRRVVSLAVSDALNVPRPQLVIERRQMGVNYGQLLVLHQLTADGAKLSDLEAEMNSGRPVLEIAKARNLSWKLLALDAKKVNSKVEDGIYKHFLNPQPMRDRDTADQYSVMIDGVKEDNEGISQSDLDEAQRVYLLYKDKASEVSSRAKRMNTVDEKNISHDHVREGKPTSEQSSDTGPK